MEPNPVRQKHLKTRPFDHERLLEHLQPLTKIQSAVISDPSRTEL